MGIYVLIQTHVPSEEGSRQTVWAEDKISLAIYQAIVQNAAEHREWSDAEGRFFLNPAGRITDLDTLQRVCSTAWTCITKHAHKILPATAAQGEQLRARQARFGFTRSVEQAHALEGALDIALMHDADIILSWA